MADTLLDHALAWAGRGFRVFPLRPGTKLPAFTGWQQSATTDEALIRRTWSAKPYNIGVLTTGMIVVDTDIKHGRDGLMSYYLLGLPLDTLAVETPTGGVHYYLSGPSVKGRIGLRDGVDIRSKGNLVVAPGSVLPGKGVYKLLHDLPVAAAPESLIELCGAPGEKLRLELTVEVDTDTNATLAKAYLETAPDAVEDGTGNDTTYVVACAVKDLGISEDFCLELMLDIWNGRCSPPWEPDALQVTVGNAYTHGINPVGISSPEAMFAGVDVPEAQHKPRLKPKWIRAWEPAGEQVEDEWLFYDRFPKKGTALLVGPSGAGKTFLAVQLAVSVATGAPFLGVAPDDPCATIILAGEGVSGMERRVRAHEGSPAISVMGISFLSDPETMKNIKKDLVEEAKALRERTGLRLGLIVIDTLAASGLLDDENSNTDCAQAVKALESLAITFDCSVVITHHPPKNGSGARGGSALHAGFDTVFEIFHDGRAVRFVECTKGRDTPTGKWGSFTLPPKHVGFDRRGRERTTCTVSMGAEEKPAGGKQPAHLEAFLLAFEWARKDSGLQKTDAVEWEKLRGSFGTIAFSGKATGTATNAFKRCVEWSEANQFLTVRRDGEKRMLLDQRPSIGEDDE